MKVLNKFITILCLVLMLSYQATLPLTVLAQESTPAEVTQSQDETAVAPSDTPVPTSSIDPTPIQSGPTETLTPTPTENIITPVEESTVTPTLSPTENPMPEISDTPTPTSTDSGSIEQPILSSQVSDTNQSSSNSNSQDQSSSSAVTTATPTPTINTPAHLSATVIDSFDASSLPQLDLNSGNQTSSASLSTDKTDYSPTGTAIISGTGLTANTLYILTISSTDDPATSTTVNITTDNSGNFIYAYQLDGNYRPNYSVELKDLAGQIVALTSFTDAPSRPNLTATKTNNLGGNATMGVAFTWTIRVANSDTATAIFNRNDVILTDNLPIGPTYGSPLVTTSGTTGTGSVSCSITSNDLTCTATGATGSDKVNIPNGAYFDVSFSVTPTSTTTLNNPRVGGSCSVDPNTLITESNEADNTCSDGPITVNSADTTPPTTTDSGIDTNWHNTDVIVTLNCSDGAGSGCATTYHTTDGSTPTTSSSTTNPFTLTTDGNYTIEYFSKDVAGNSESVKTATNTVKIDKTNPTDPTDVHSTSHTVSTPSSDATIDMAWTIAGSAPGATDALSGVDGYSYSFTNGATDVPDTIKDAEESVTTTTSSTLADGTWYFHLRTLDNAGNWTSTVHAGPFIISTTPDLTVTKTNNVSGTVNINSGFNWTITITNSGLGSATFTTGQTLLTDNLPSSNATYGTVLMSNGGGTTGTVACSITTSNLSCTASGGSVVIPGSGIITITVPVTAGASAGTLANPRAAGVCSVDPNTVVTESNEANNACANSVTVVASPDLIVSKTNNLGGGNAINGVAFNWILTISNTGAATASFGNNNVVLTDELPIIGATYGTPTFGFGGGASGGGTTCSIASQILTCASHSAGGNVSLPVGGTFTITIPTTPTANGALVNPRTAGTCAIDPGTNITESNESNNSCSNSVTVGIPDTTPPTLTQITPVTTSNSAPNYTFNTDEAGTISYGGDCSSATITAVVGNNTITFNTLADGTHSNCTITVTDASSNSSTPLSVNTFTVDTTAPVITITNPSTTPAQSKTITASTNEGTLTMSNTTGSICNGTLAFVSYSSQTFNLESDNGTKVCYRAIDAVNNTTYNISAAIAGIDTTATSVSTGGTISSGGGGSDGQSDGLGCGSHDCSGVHPATQNPVSAVLAFGPAAGFAESVLGKSTVVGIDNKADVIASDNGQVKGEATASAKEVSPTPEETNGQLPFNIKVIVIIIVFLAGGFALFRSFFNK